MFSVQLEKRNKTLKRYDQICFPKNSWFSIESMSANLLELTFPNVSRYTTREHTFICSRNLLITEVNFLLSITDHSDVK